MDRIERLFWMAAVVVLACILFFKGCKKQPDCNGLEITKTITIEKIITGKSDSSYKPMAENTGGKDNDVLTMPFAYQPATSPDADYFSAPALMPSIAQQDPAPLKIINKYQDTLHFGTNGYAVVKDSVAGEILKRSFSYSLIQLETVQQVLVKKRNKVFFGVDAVGNKATPIKYFGLKGAFQNKRNDNIILIGAGIMDKQITYSGGLLIKL